MHLRRYNALSYEFLGEIEDADDVQMSWSMRGPDTATIQMPAAYARELGMSGLAPGGTGCMVEIDAQEEGIQQVWLGKARLAQGGSGSGAVSLQCVGPLSLWEKESVAAIKTGTIRSGIAIQRVITGHPVPLRVKLGQICDGVPVWLDAKADSLAAFIANLTKQSGELPWLDAEPGKCQWVLDWNDPRVPFSMADLVTLDDSNAEAAFAYPLDFATDHLVTIGQSMLSGMYSEAVGAAAPQGIVVGRKAALSAPLATYRVDSVKKEPVKTEVRPELSAGAALANATMVSLRNYLTPPLPATITVTKNISDLWRYIQPQRLVRVSFEDDFFGVYQDGIAVIRTMSVSVWPKLGLNLSADLWERL